MSGDTWLEWDRTWQELNVWFCFLGMSGSFLEVHLHVRCFTLKGEETMKAKSQQCLYERPEGETTRLTHWEMVNDEPAALSAQESLQWLSATRGPQATAVTKSLQGKFRCFYVGLDAWVTDSECSHESSQVIPSQDTYWSLNTVVTRQHQGKMKVSQVPGGLLKCKH